MSISKAEQKKWGYLITWFRALFGKSSKLIEKFGYPWEMMPLMYVILKDTSGDIDEASKRIEEAIYFEVEGIENSL
uniref:Doublesex dimerisation domain-containing protein n=1 Tax=Glossina palpalis gambiensis TaxID=67801 RepID=A0A1B0C560_9MUSC